MKHEHMESVKMKWEHGEEAVCVRCGHRNAMLRTGHIGNIAFYECRDCHCVVAHHKMSIARGDSEDYEHAVIIGRSIGKTCHKCHHFVDEYSKRADFDDDNRVKAGYWCDNCGTYWGN